MSSHGLTMGSRDGEVPGFPDQVGEGREGELGRVCAAAAECTGSGWRVTLFHLSYILVAGITI